MKLHRNSQKRIVFEDACYFVTFYTKHRFPYFKESIFCDLFVENLRLCKQLKGFLLYGWVVIYEHIHLMIQPNNKYNISDVMQFLKRHTSRNINICMGYASWPRSATPESDIGQCRFQDGEMVVQRNHKTLTQKLHKFDIFVRISKTRFQIKYKNQKTFLKPCLPCLPDRQAAGRQVQDDTSHLYFTSFFAKLRIWKEKLIPIKLSYQSPLW
jgi:REP element-mobilizing transposase RayT